MYLAEDLLGEFNMSKYINDVVVKTVVKTVKAEKAKHITLSACNYPNLRNLAENAKNHSENFMNIPLLKR